MDSRVHAEADVAHRAVAVKHVDAAGMIASEPLLVREAGEVLHGRTVGVPANVVVESEVHVFVVAAVASVAKMIGVQVLFARHVRVACPPSDHGKSDFAAAEDDAGVQIGIAQGVGAVVHVGKTGGATAHLVRLDVAHVGRVVGPGQRRDGVSGVDVVSVAVVAEGTDTATAWAKK